MKTFDMPGPGGYLVGTFINVFDPGTYAVDQTDFFNPSSIQGYISQASPLKTSWPYFPWHSDPIYMALGSLNIESILPDLTHCEGVTGIRLDSPKNYEYSLGVDSKRFGSLLGDVGLSASILGHVSNIDGQHNVTHVTAEGRFSYDYSNLSRVDFTLFNDSLAGYRTNDVNLRDRYGAVVQSQDDFSFTSSFEDFVSKAQNVSTEEIDEYNYTFEWSSGSSRYRLWLLPDIVLYQTPEFYELSYTVQQAWQFEPSYSRERRWNTDVSVKFYRSYDIDYTEGEVSYYDADSYWYIEYSSVVTSVIKDDAHSHYSPYVGRVLSFRQRAMPLTISEIPSLISVTDYSYDAILRLRAFCNMYISNNFEKLTGAAMVSTTDAVDGFNRVMENSILEDMADLLDISYIDVSVGTDFLQLILSNYGLNGLLRIVDIAADTFLLIKFGLEPNIRDVQQFAQHWDELVNQRVVTGGTLYGKATHTFELNGIPVTMVTRSEIRYQIPKGHWLITMFALKRFGIDPTLSNLYDFVPFGFAADWFLKIGDRLSYIDSSLFLAMGLVEYYVHSFSVYVDINDVPGFEGIGQLTYYRREVSKFLPWGNPQTNNFFDWFGGTSVPNAIAAALLWNLL